MLSKLVKLKRKSVTGAGLLCGHSLTIFRPFASNGKGNSQNPLSVNSLYYNVQNSQTTIYCKVNQIHHSYFKIFIQVLNEKYKLNHSSSSIIFILYSFYSLFPLFLTSGYYDYLVKSLSAHIIPEFLLAALIKIAPKVKSPNSGSSFTQGHVIASFDVRSFLTTFETQVTNDTFHGMLVEIPYFGKVQSYWTKSVKADLLQLITTALRELDVYNPESSYKFLKKILDALPSVFYGNSCSFVTHTFTYTSTGLTPIGVFRFRNFDTVIESLSHTPITYVLPQSSVKGFDIPLFEMFCVFLFLTRPVYLAEDGEKLPRSVLAGEGVIDLTNVMFESAFELLLSLQVTAKIKVVDDGGFTPPDEMNKGERDLKDSGKGGPNLQKVKPGADKNNKLVQAGKAALFADVPDGFKGPARKFSTSTRSLHRVVDYQVHLDYNSFIYKRIDYGLHQPLSIITVYNPGDI